MFLNVKVTDHFLPLNATEALDIVGVLMNKVLSCLELVELLLNLDPIALEDLFPNANWKLDEVKNCTCLECSHHLVKLMAHTAANNATEALVIAGVSMNSEMKCSEQEAHHCDQHQLPMPALIFTRVCSLPTSDDTKVLSMVLTSLNATKRMEVTRQSNATRALGIAGAVPLSGLKSLEHEQDSKCLNVLVKSLQPTLFLKKRNKSITQPQL
jgi:endonuclease/exonuclease/phosphatase family metal-dependent hydrolase